MGYLGLVTMENKTIHFCFFICSKLFTTQYLLKQMAKF